MVFNDPARLVAELRERAEWMRSIARQIREDGTDEFEDEAAQLQEAARACERVIAKVESGGA